MQDMSIYLINLHHNVFKHYMTILINRKNTSTDSVSGNTFLINDSKTACSTEMLMHFFDFSNTLLQDVCIFFQNSLDTSEHKTCSILVRGAVPL